MTDYAEILIGLIEEAGRKNEEAIEAAARLIADCNRNNGVIYMFGCGHSGLIAQDCFYRAGGLANIQPIFIPELMLHVSASESSRLEKDEKNAKDILNGYYVTQNDLLFVFSVSGINGVPVDVARQGREKGLKVIGMGSSAYFEEKSRHSSGKRLSDYSDIFLDNCVPKGDSVLDLEDKGKAVPVSTAICSFLIQSCIYKAFEEFPEMDFFGSGNLSENAKKNKELVEKYKKRIKSL